MDLRGGGEVRSSSFGILWRDAIITSCSQSNRPPSLASAVLRWQRDSFRARGLAGSFRYLAEQFVECVKDSLPERRRSRFGDIDYDCDHAVDTTWARLPISVRLREVFSERLYQPTVEEEFAEIMQHLATVDFETFTFIDLGSGKGRALLLAAMYPFAHIVGVEVQPELDAIARQNIERFDESGQQCHSIESVCADAREYDFPLTDLVVYLFNPFPDYVLAGSSDQPGGFGATDSTLDCCALQCAL